MMNATMQPSAFETRETEILHAAVTAAEAGPSQNVATVEYGSGWYHDAAIVASEQASTQRH